MKKQRLLRLQALLGVYQRLEDLARIEYMKSRKDWVEEVDKQDQLKKFKGEYRERLQQIGQQGTLSVKLQELALFIGQLETNIERQQSTIAHYLRKNQEKSREYLCAKSKTKSLQILVDQLVKDLQLEQDKITQKENDEYAQNIWYSNDKNRL